MLVMGVLAIALLDHALGHWLPARFDPRWQKPDAAQAGPLVAPTSWRAIALFYLFIVLGATMTWLPRWEIETPRYRRLYSLKPRLGDWQGLGLQLDERFFGSVGYTEWVHRRYRHADIEAQVFIGADNRLEPRLSSISPKNEIPGIGYTLHDRTTVDILPGGPRGKRAILRRAGQTVATFTWYQSVGPIGSEVLRSALSLDRGPLRRPDRALVIRVVMPLPDDRGVWGGMERRLGDLMRHVVEETERLQD
jgi:hypothetical protein